MGYHLFQILGIDIRTERGETNDIFYSVSFKGKKASYYSMSEETKKQTVHELKELLKFLEKKESKKKAAIRQDQKYRCLKCGTESRIDSVEGFFCEKCGY